jgi:hypothetical protein
LGHPTFGKVSAERKRRTVELVGDEADAAIEAGGERANFVGEVEGLSVDEEVLELKRHGKALRKRGEKSLWDSRLGPINRGLAQPKVSSTVLLLYYLAAKPLLSIHGGD